ncbi:MAG TPA: preprotein translocase subunit SecG [Gammaproteobacteria bacterium]|nr:preprotein translocase subunit SecG [Gammaproteobacteria bacterium]
MDIILLVLHVVLSLGIITLVLLQKGAGASAGAAFGGGGGAGSVFGASGSANFLSKATALFAIGFFLNSLVLAYLAANRDVQTDSVIDALVEPPATELSVPAPEGDVTEIPVADIPAAADDETPAIDTSSETDVPPPAGD